MIRLFFRLLRLFTHYQVVEIRKSWPELRAGVPFRITTTIQMIRGQLTVTNLTVHKGGGEDAVSPAGEESKG